MDKYRDLVDDAISYAKEKGGDDDLSTVLDRLAINFGKRILEAIPGRVSTEIDARLSYDTEGTIAKCKKLAEMYSGFCFSLCLID